MIQLELDFPGDGMRMQRADSRLTFRKLIDKHLAQIAGDLEVRRSAWERAQEIIESRRTWRQVRK